MGSGTEMIVPYANFRGIITWCKMQMIGGISTLCLTTAQTAGLRWMEDLTMRPVDADAIYNEALENHQKGEIEDWEADLIINYLDGAPTINTVEIVYCKDCKHKVRTDANGIVICSEEHGMYCPTENDFCSYGKRRDDDVSD